MKDNIKHIRLITWEASERWREGRLDKIRDDSGHNGQNREWDKKGQQDTVQNQDFWQERKPARGSKTHRMSSKRTHTGLPHTGMCCYRRKCSSLMDFSTDTNVDGQNQDLRSIRSSLKAFLKMSNQLLFVVDVYSIPSLTMASILDEKV